MAIKIISKHFQIFFLSLCLKKKGLFYMHTRPENQFNHFDSIQYTQQELIEIGRANKKKKERKNFHFFLCHTKGGKKRKMEWGKIFIEYEKNFSISLFEAISLSLLRLKCIFIYIFFLSFHFYAFLFSEKDFLSFPSSHLPPLPSRISPCTHMSYEFP